MKMTVLMKLKEYLEKNRVRYEVGYYEIVYTSQEIAAAMHVPGRELVKVVMAKADRKEVMLVLPASCQVETKKLKTAVLHFSPARTTRRLAQTASLPPIREPYARAVPAIVFHTA